MATQEKMVNFGPGVCDDVSQCLYFENHIIYLTLGPLVALVSAVAVGALLVIWSREFDSFGVLATEADPVLHTT